LGSKKERGIQDRRDPDIYKKSQRKEKMEKDFSKLRENIRKRGM
jgi:hypothetical protein